MTLLPLPHSMEFSFKTYIRKERLEFGCEHKVFEGNNNLFIELDK